MDYLELHLNKKIILIGPKKKGALLESSKKFAKEFLYKHKIPTAKYQSFNSSELTNAISFITKMNKFVFVVALPALLFEDIGSANFYEAWDTTYVLYCFGATLLSILISFFISIKPSQKQMILSLCLPNFAFVSCDNLNSLSSGHVVGLFLIKETMQVLKRILPKIAPVSLLAVKPAIASLLFIFKS